MSTQPSPLAERSPSRRIRLGNVEIGDGAPVSIQSMTITKTEDVGATLIQIHALATQGADIVACGGALLAGPPARLGPGRPDGRCPSGGGGEGGPEQG